MLFCEKLKQYFLLFSLTLLRENTLSILQMIATKLCYNTKFRHTRSMQSSLKVIAEIIAFFV